MAQLTRESELVKRFANKQFKLVGILVGDVKKISERIENKKMNWTTFVERLDDAVITTKWNARGLSEIFIIDYNGIIRYRDMDDDEIEKAVEGLLAEMPQQNK